MRKAKQKFCASHVTHRNALASQMKKRDKKERDEWTAINKLKDPFRVGEEVEKFAKLCEEHDATGKGVQRPEFSRGAVEWILQAYSKTMMAIV